MTDRLALPMILALFSVSLLVFSFVEIRRHPDERRYVIASAKMLASQDFLIPRTEDDTVRLKKPPLPYYMMAASFAALGQNLLAAKVLWIAASLCIVALTAYLAQLLGASREGAALAAATLAGNLVFLRSAITTLPDTPLVLFLLVSALGFLTALFAPSPPRWAVWAAFCGAALAILSKGLLAVAFLTYSLAFAALFARDRVRHLLHLPAIAVAAAPVLGWYGYAILTHPAEFANDFVGDQLTSKVTFGIGDFLYRLAINPLMAAAAFWPWVALSTLLMLGRRRMGRPEPWGAGIYLLGWCALVTLIFGFSGHITERYMLPIYPIVAAFVGVGLSRMDAKSFVAAARWPAWAMAALVALVSAFCGITLVAAQAPLLGLVVAAGAMAIVMALLLTSRGDPMRATLMLTAASTWIAISIASIAFQLSHPNVHAVAARVLDDRRPAGEHLTVINSEANFYAGLILHGLDLRNVTFATGLDGLDTDEIAFAVTTEEPVAALLRADGFKVDSVSAKPRHIRTEDALEALLEWRLAEYLEENRGTIYIASPAVR